MISSISGRPSFRSLSDPQITSDETPDNEVGGNASTSTNDETLDSNNEQYLNICK